MPRLGLHDRLERGQVVRAELHPPRDGGRAIRHRDLQFSEEELEFADLGSALDVIHIAI
ncbi:hypothetical protein GCM10017608_02410 [Agromyces luteolus]|nr:hypothetical protein GCM10017608_02410 [Agromyces luteolus]